MIDVQQRVSWIGSEGTQRLRQSRVVLVGVGGIGCVVADLLVRSGVGKLTLIDRDVVDQDNLHRQVLYTHHDVGSPKALCAVDILGRIGSATLLSGFPVHLDVRNIHQLCKGADLIIDASDNLEVRHVINEYCLDTKSRWIFAAGSSDHGMIKYFEGAPCFSCLINQGMIGESCGVHGVVGSLTSVVGSYQAHQAIRVLVGHKVDSSLFVINPTTMKIHRVECTTLSCPVCSGGQRVSEHYQSVVLCGGRYQIIGYPMDMGSLKERFAGAEYNKGDNGWLRVLVDGHELVVFKDGRCLIKATSLSEAQRIHAQYLGG